MSKPYTSKHIYHISDTFDDRAKGKIDSAYTLHKGRLGIRETGYTFTPALNSIDAGISVSEAIRNSQRPDRLIIAVNYAPPDMDKKEGTKDNARKDFFCAQLKDNVTVSGTTNGHEFSYVKDQVVDFFRLTNTNSLKSQFRSLEILPEHALLFSKPKLREQLVKVGVLERVKDKHIDTIIPTVPNQTHAFEIDNFQNVKLFPSIEDLALLRKLEGNKVIFGFGSASNEIGTRLALVSPTLFAPPEKTTVVALRSSSTRFGVESAIPIIATLRQLPAETKPDYTPPAVGVPVWFKPRFDVASNG